MPSGKNEVSENPSIVNVSDFVTVEVEGYEEWGGSKGEIVYLAGDLLARVGPEDPYLLRQTFLAIPCDPTTGSIKFNSKPFTISGDSVLKVEDDQQAELEAIRDDDLSNYNAATPVDQTPEEMGVEEDS